MTDSTLASFVSLTYIGQVKRVLLSILIAVIGLSAIANASHFRFVNGNPRQNDQMHLILDVASLRLTTLLEVKLPDTLTIAIVETQQQFDSLTGGRMPDWSAGAAVPARDLILLRRPMMNQYPGSLSDLLEHELAHIALHNRVGGKYLPRFIDEGFASWFAGEWTFTNITTVAAAQLTRSILPLQKIDDVNSFHQAQANLAYSQSYLVVFYIYQRFGELGFLDLLDAFAAGKGVSDAFRIALGVSFWDFELSYRQFLANNYTVFTILSDTMGFWIILAVVVIIGYLMVRKRKKDVLDRWKEEEKYESTDFDYTGSDDEPWKNPTDNEDSEDFSSRR
ncbi:MAG: hypothetical protein E4G91_11405 [Candidatus Zixiibacteriota bacterium]|nr:MAG: hypothetical protein E4G91_11405 [candidate division Zixibacteria bacterium]